MFPTQYMGLIAWDVGSDPYDHAQLSNNFKAIDQHTHEVGKGIQVPSGGIADSAVITAKIADLNVTTVKYAAASVTQGKLAKPSVGTPELTDLNVTTGKLADGAVTIAKLDANILPLGSCVLWYTTDLAQVGPPGGMWEPLDGRAWSAVTNKLGPGQTQWNTGSMPDTRNAFPLGAAVTGTGSGPTLPPSIGQIGGAQTANLSHSHNVNAHAHTVPDHTHTVPNHAHAIGADGSHNHGMHSRQTRTLRQDQTGNDSYLQTLYVAGFNSGGGDAVVPTDGAHSHGGATGGSGAFSTTGSGTFSTTSNATATDAQLNAATDIRPKFVGFLIICRVR